MTRTPVAILGALCWIGLAPVAFVCAQSPNVYDTPEAASADPDFAIQGEYVGANTGMQVIALGGGDFEIVLYGGGLPGSGWDRLPPTRVDGNAATVKQIAETKSLMRTERRSSSLGAKPPQGAIVLFDGTPASLEKNWKPGAKITNDGLLVQGATTTQTFQDYSLHVEFRTPFQPKAEGQGRGNSGLYHQGRYETQILDSFGLAGKNNEAGGIYEIRDPDFNACFPPLSWQTYDVDFTAARYDESGKKIADALITAKLNGMVVQRDVAVPRATRAAPVKEGVEPGPLVIQNHGNPVRFRNIWIMPRDAQRDDRRPVVAGFERFFTDEALGGRILVQQLACTACHASNDPMLARKQAPVLDNVGERIRLDAMHAVVANPRQLKQGTTMPDLFHGISDAERKENADAIASFLASTGTITDRPGDSLAIERGEVLFHSIGCVACHDPRRAGVKKSSTSVPLGDITSKYTLDSLSRFLLNPHAVRTSGNMPKVVNTLTEARDIACYLIGDKIVAPGSQQYTATVYYGTWDKLPDFSQLKPEKSGTTTGLDLEFAGRRDNYAIVFEAFLPISVEGNYRFYIASDDGSRLLIDDKQVIKHDGIHPRTEKMGARKLEAGVHKLRIEYFEGSRDESLSLEVEGPEIGRVPIDMLVTANEKGEMKKELIPSQFRPDPALVAKGRSLFAKSGCASCHLIKQDGATVVSEVKAPPLELVKVDRGCLATEVTKGLPDYELSSNQRTAIAAAIQSLANPLTDNDKQHLMLAGSNCYACHVRGTVGGPEPNRDTWFQTKTPEMGNEGRLPPPLTGVGDKLRPEVLDKIMDVGAKDRPYVLTRMPGFGKESAKRFAEQFEAADRASTSPSSAPKHGLPSRESDDGKQLIVAGRKLTGGEGLACIKCHVFGNKATPGLQAMDLLKMSDRLREDWFHRYMLAPSEYRPGTRMPLSFPEGKSVLTSVFDGDANKQIDALWLYLSEGKNARPPVGIDAASIVLSADAKPVIYRNFLEGLTPRGIAVGYPERVNLAWDANQMALSLVWKNEFLDASKHWVGRGPGNQSPLGDFVIKLETVGPLARLDSLDATWPTGTARSRNYQFRGYVLNAAGQPTFRYAFAGTEVEDKPTPRMSSSGKVDFVRTLTLRPQPGEGKLIFRAAEGDIQPQADGSYQVDGLYRLRVDGIPLQVVTVGGKKELRGVVPDNGSITLTETISW